MSRVLQFIADGSQGGRANHVLQLMSGLQPSFECTLLTQHGSYLAKQAKVLGLDTLCGEFTRGNMTLSASSALRRVLRDCRPDLIHSHGSRSAFLNSIVRSNAASVHTVHGGDYASALSHSPSRLRWCRDFWSVHRHNKMLFLCDYDRRLLKSEKLLRAEKPFDVIYPGVPDVPQANAPAKRLGIGFIGRMDLQKNPTQFVKVIGRIPDADAVMVGAGVLGPRVRDAIRAHGLGDRIKLFGAKSHEQALELLSQLDVLVITSRWESTPMLALEAMSLGVPVVSTSVGGIPEIITHGQTGLLAKSGTADDLAVLTKNILSNEELRSSIVERAKKAVANEFAQDTMIRRLSDCYSKCLSTENGLAKKGRPNRWPGVSQPVRG